MEEVTTFGDRRWISRSRGFLTSFVWYSVRHVCAAASLRRFLSVPPSGSFPSFLPLLLATSPSSISLHRCCTMSYRSPSHARATRRPPSRFPGYASSTSSSTFHDSRYRPYVTSSSASRPPRPIDPFSLHVSAPAWYSDYDLQQVIRTTFAPYGTISNILCFKGDRTRFANVSFTSTQVRCCSARAVLTESSADRVSRLSSGCNPHLGKLSPLRTRSCSFRGQACMDEASGETAALHYVQDKTITCHTLIDRPFCLIHLLPLDEARPCISATLFLFVSSL